MTRPHRRVAGGALVLAVSVSAVLAARGRYRPYTSQAPEYRQKGPRDARVVVVEYSDFECPACRAAIGPLRQILALHGKDIRITFKHFPLDRPHPSARAGAAAAECAGRQGRFWEFHDALFDRQDDWPDRDNERGRPALAERLAAYAQGLKLDVPAFDACMKSAETPAAIESDVAEGRSRMVSSTPTFFINGRRVTGGRQLATRGLLWIEKALKKP